MDGTVALCRAAAARTHLVSLADSIFDRFSPYEGDAFRNHCLRMQRFTIMLMRSRGPSLAPDLVYLIAMVHDLGLVVEGGGANYLQRSRALFHRETAGVDLGNADPAIIDECLLYNHRLLPVPGMSPEAECFRRAVIIEHARGLVTCGLDRAAVHEVFDELPRHDLDRILCDFAWRTLRREPLTIVSGIFA